MTEIPMRFDPTHSVGEVVRMGEERELQPGDESGVVVTVAGRLMLSRPQGRIAFGELRDWTGAVQLFATEGATEGFEELTRVNLGDWIGVTGEIIRTRRGELSVKVASYVLLAHARLGFGEKWRGIADPDLRYRQREVDLWANEGVRDAFLMRSRVLAWIRRYLDARGFVEVETPILHPIAGGAHARPFVAHYNALHADFYLRIAIELYLKRLVVGGIERVYEIGRVFRNEGISPRHNPEFTMLELYQAYADYTDMMALTESMVSGVVQEMLGTTVLTYQERRLDLTLPWRRATMSELIHERTGKKVELEMGEEALRAVAAELGIEPPAGAGAGGVMFEIYEELVEPTIWDPVFVCDYPQEVSPLARPHRSKPGYVERFEPVVAGRELGNAFTELTDPDEQLARFLEQAARRAAGDPEAMVVDADYVRALEHGLPPTGGLGIGIDRLVMLMADASHIRGVILFPALRPVAAGSEGEVGGESSTTP